MKIPGSIRGLYAEQQATFKQLKERVDKVLKPRLHERWHYESRVKSEEGFTLKIESGRVRNVAALEDFFAATIVVQNASEIATAEALVQERFAFDSRKPPFDAVTSLSPDKFLFDDLRLYVRWMDDDALPPTGLAGSLFEIQIKTFLQHAWSIATHDLTYKTDDMDWGKMRIAFQIKAMLEHAELSIQEATRLATSTALNKTDERTAAVKEYIALFAGLWAKDDLPSDIRRLAENVMVLTKLVNIDAPTLKTLLEEEKAAGRGPLTLNLTPYGIVVQTLLFRKKDAMSAALKQKLKRQVILTRELEMPDDIEAKMCQNAAIFIS